MNSNPRIVLQPGREKSIKQRHPLVFSGAVAKWPTFEDGDLLNVQSHSGEYLGCGQFRKGASLAGRMLWFAESPEDTDFQQWAVDRFVAALGLRTSLPLDGNAWRAVAGESDGMPGVTLDRYAEYWVIQISSVGMERNKEHLISAFRSASAKAGVNCKGMYQKVVPRTSAEPGTLESSAWIYGSGVDSVTIQENGLSFRVEFEGSQKTGFFLDQRENRAYLRTLSRNRRVLNCFSYTGGFSVYAASGGASRVVSVDSSEKAIALAKENFSLNQISQANHGFEASDVFEYLRSVEEEFDIIVLDPPAFARTKRDLPQAMRGYRDIHRLAFQVIEKGGLVLTSSCSHPVDSDLMRKIIFQAALEARRDVRILQSHRQSPDHPLSIFYPEGDYLKGFLLHID